MKPLHQAAANGNIPEIKKLIDGNVFRKGIPVDELDELGLAPIHRAAQKGQVVTIQYLLRDCKANVNQIANGFHSGATALHFAAANGHDEAVQCLIEFHVNATAVTTTKDGGGCTALHWASFNGFLNVVKILIPFGGINQSSDDGNTALHMAVGQGCYELAQYLIEEANADITIRNKAGKTAYDLAETKEMKNLFIKPLCKFGEKFLKEKQWDDALECFNGVVRIEPDSIIALNKIGKISHKKKYYEKALQSFQSALFLDEKNIDSLYGKGRVLRAQEQLDSALECYVVILDLNPKFFPACFEKADLLLQKGDTAQALECYNAFLNVTPIHRTALIEKGKILAYQKKYPEAVDNFLNALEHYPDDTDLLNLLGYVYLRQNQFTKADLTFRTVLQNVESALALQGNILINFVRTQNFDNTLDPFTQVEKLAENNKKLLATLFYERGEIYEENGKGEESKIYYKQALDYQPNYWLAKKALSRGETFDEVIEIMQEIKETCEDILDVLVEIQDNLSEEKSVNEITAISKEDGESLKSNFTSKAVKNQKLSSSVKSIKNNHTSSNKNNNNVQTQQVTENKTVGWIDWVASYVYGGSVTSPVTEDVSAEKKSQQNSDKTTKQNPLPLDSVAKAEKSTVKPKKDVKAVTITATKKQQTENKKQNLVDTKHSAVPAAAKVSLFEEEDDDAADFLGFFAKKDTVEIKEKFGPPSISKSSMQKQNVNPAVSPSNKPSVKSSVKNNAANNQTSAVNAAERSWHIDINHPQYVEALNKNEYIFPASKKDWSKVLEIYQQCPVPGYDLKEVNVIFNKQLNRVFEGRLDALNNRHDVQVFKAKWEKDSHPEWRRKVNDMAEALAKPYVDPSYPHVKILPLWHGTSADALSVIVKTGYANLATTDSGYFGKGYYGAREPEYAHRVYGNGTLVLNWVSFYSAYPTIAGDKEKLMGKTNHENYDAHFVPVIPPDGKFSQNAMVYVPCEPNQKHQYTEVVVFDSAQCLARYSVVLQPSLPKEPQLAMTASNQNSNAKETIKSIEEAYKKGCALYAKKQYTEALPYLEQAAKQGHAVGQNLLGAFYREGLGISQDYMQAFYWHKQSAEQGYAAAQYNLGWFYINGKGVSQDYHLAVDWYQKSAAQNYGLAQCGLGACYYNGHGVLRDYKQAVEWFQKAANQGNANAQYYLGLCYSNGLGLTKSDEQALHWYQKAAKQGYKLAQENLDKLTKQNPSLIKLGTHLNSFHNQPSSSANYSVNNNNVAQSNFIFGNK